MAARYSGNVTLRITLRHMKGWSGEVGWFYIGEISLPGQHAEAILSPREAGIRGRDLSSPEAYDKVASAMLHLGDEETRGLVGEEAVRKGNDWEILRVQQSPCPLENHVARRRTALKRTSRRSSRRRDPQARACEVSRPGHHMVVEKRGCLVPAYATVEIEPVFGDYIRTVKEQMSLEDAEACAGTPAARDQRRGGDLQKAALHYLRHEAPDHDEYAMFARATTREVAEHLGVPLETARRTLQSLAKKGVIYRAGRIEPGKGFQGHKGGVLGLQLWEINYRSETS